MFKTLTRISLAGLLTLSSLTHAAETAPDSLRIGYQKGSVSMVLAKSHQLRKNASHRPNSPGWSFLPGHKRWKGAERWKHRFRQYWRYSTDLCAGGCG